MNHNQELIDIAHCISELLVKELGKRPYGANIIDELHAGENAHSRILKVLLKYSGGGKYPIYNHFLQLIRSRCQANVGFLSCNSPHIKNEDGHIDLLIKDGKDKKFAIIIENKVCGAGDQDTQLERYVKKVIKESFSPKNIIVIYLTKDGQKEVSEISLTDEVKGILEYSDESDGRYIKLDYKHHIIPWLEQIIPEMPIKEELLIAALRQYLDYLKGICGERESDKPIYKRIRKKMIDKLKLNSVQDYLRAIRDVSLLKEQIDIAVKELLQDLLKEHFYKPLYKLLDDLFSGYEIISEDYEGYHKYQCGFHCKIAVPTWNYTYLIFNPEGVGQLFGIVHKDIELHKVDESVCNALRERLRYDGETSLVWPWWKPLRVAVSSAETYEFLLDIENGKFFDVYSEWLKEVAAKTKDLEL
ncbi:MAG: PD-(D/E)XK nuclease family protein [Muribaculaceae bacterium]|nr:PD-(D/E)XK nuclease family protein [Muribaculaceae bacterium]